QPHSFHQKAGSSFRGSASGRGVSRVEINLELAFGPKDHFVDGVVPIDVANLRVAALPACEIQLTLLAAFLHDKSARLLAHLERLHQTGDAHLHKTPWNRAGRGGPLLQLPEMQTVHNFFGDAPQIFYQERLSNKFSPAGDQGTKALLNTRAARHKEK